MSIPSRVPLSNKAIEHFNKIRGHCLAIANEVDELDPETADISDAIKNKFDVSIWKFRDICLFMNEVYNTEEKKKKDFDNLLKGSSNE